MEKKDPKSSRLYITSIEKGMRVLKSFEGPHRYLSLSEIAAKAGMDLSSAQRCVHTLFSLGYLSRDNASQKYQLSVRLMDFTFQYLASHELVNRTFPYLQQLSRKTGETVNLTVLDGTEIVFILRFLSQHVLAGDIMVGTRLPAYCMSSGLAMMACLPENEVTHVLERSHLVKHTPFTTANPETILKRLEAIRIQGYAHTEEEYYLGDISTAAAIRDCQGYPIGSINVAVSKSRWEGQKDEKRIADLLISVTSVLSDQPKNF